MATEINTTTEVDNCITNSIKKRHTSAALKINSEKLNFSRVVCDDKDQLWMAVYQHEDVDRGNILLRTFNEGKRDETYFNFHFEGYKLQAGTYNMDNKAFQRVELDFENDEYEKMQYSGKEITDGKLSITERDEKTMRGTITCTIPELKLKETKEVIYQNVQCEFSFYIKKPFKFKIMLKLFNKRSFYMINIIFFLFQ